MFANVYVGSAKIDAPWTNESDWKLINRAAMEAVNGKGGQS
jgi:hypothetical protein